MPAHARRTIAVADIATARRAAELHPDSAKGIVSLATLLYEIGEKSAASALFEKALHLDASLSSAWYYHGLLASDEGKWNAAGEDFRRSLKLSPNDAPAHLALAEVLLRMGAFDECASELTTAARLDPWDAGAHYGLGLLRVQQGDFVGAQAEFQRVLVLNPDLTPAFLNN